MFVAGMVSFLKIKFYSWKKILHREHGAFEQQYLSVLTFPIEDLSYSQDFRFAAHSLAKFY